MTCIQIIERSHVDWNYEFPDDRRVFIDDLISRYKAQNLELGKVIEFAFHTSLRNAFAHSDFVVEKGTIWLDTYKSDRPWDIQSIEIEDWTLKFVISSFLDHIFFIKKEQIRNALPPGTMNLTIKNL